MQWNRNNKKKFQNNGYVGIYIPGISEPVIDGNTFINNPKNILIHPESVGLATITNNNLSVLSILGTTINSSANWPVSSDGVYELDHHITVAEGADAPSPEDAAIADVNGDGYLDVMVAAELSYTSSVRERMSSELFDPRRILVMLSPASSCRLISLFG